MVEIECAGFIFNSNFDSGNLGRVEYVEGVPRTLASPRILDLCDTPHHEFNIWTQPDCFGTEFQNANRTWFYFGVRETKEGSGAHKKSRKGYRCGSSMYLPDGGDIPGHLIRFNLVDINKQAKLYAHGMAPVVRVMPSRPNWERLKEKLSFSTVQDHFMISFTHRLVENTNETTYFAFTFPYTYVDLQLTLSSFDKRFNIKTDGTNFGEKLLPLETAAQTEEVESFKEKKPVLAVRMNNATLKRFEIVMAKKCKEDEISRLMQTGNKPEKEMVSLQNVPLKYEPNVNKEKLSLQEVFKNISMTEYSDELISIPSVEHGGGRRSSCNSENSPETGNTGSTISPEHNSQLRKSASTSASLKTLFTPVDPKSFSHTEIVESVSSVKNDECFGTESLEAVKSNPETISNSLRSQLLGETGYTSSSPDIIIKNTSKSNELLLNVSTSNEIKGLPYEVALNICKHPDDIYYYRECVSYSLQNRRIDLLTISSYNNITTEREERLKHLFPEADILRPFKFKGKKVIFVSARVHPGEVPSSYILHGFMNLLLDRFDPIAINLRRLYVFKIIPFLNPDGVANGHYRTDTRGVNLNRVYNTPSLYYHPSVYAARALIRYYHLGYESYEPVDEKIVLKTVRAKRHGNGGLQQPLPVKKIIVEPNKISPAPTMSEETAPLDELQLLRNDPNNPLRKLQDTLIDSINLMVNSKGDDEVEQPVKVKQSPGLKEVVHLWCEHCCKIVYELEVNMGGSLPITSEKDNSCRSCKRQMVEIKSLTDIHGSIVGDTDSHDDSSPAEDQDGPKANTSQSSIGSSVESNSSAEKSGTCPPKAINDKRYTLTQPKYPYQSNLFMYIDMHGHASKRGIFMYGNHIAANNAANAEIHELPRLMALNSLHFHYRSCNFTERNMYCKDRRDGAGREGCGRVAVWQATGVVRSYTLEANYNTGRTVNVLPMRPGDKHLRGGGTPPKYGPKVYEEVGRALGPSILDLTESNPMSRLASSEFRSMSGLRDLLVRHGGLGGKMTRSTHLKHSSRHTKTRSMQRKDPAKENTCGRSKTSARHNKLVNHISVRNKNSNIAKPKVAKVVDLESPDAKINSKRLKNILMQPSCSQTIVKSPPIISRHLPKAKSARRLGKSASGAKGILHRGLHAIAKAGEKKQNETRKCSSGDDTDSSKSPSPGMKQIKGSISTNFVIRHPNKRLKVSALKAKTLNSLAEPSQKQVAEAKTIKSTKHSAIGDANTTNLGGFPIDNTMTSGPGHSKNISISAETHPLNSKSLKSKRTIQSFKNLVLPDQRSNKIEKRKKLKPKFKL